MTPSTAGLNKSPGLAVDGGGALQSGLCEQQHLTRAVFTVVRVYRRSHEVGTELGGRRPTCKA